MFHAAWTCLWVMVQNLKGWKLLQFSYYSLPWFISLLLVSLLLFSNDAWDCYTYPCFIAWGVCLVYFFICKHTSGHSSEVWATPKNALFLVLLVLLPVLALELNLESPILKFIVWFSQVLMVLIWTGNFTSQCPWKTEHQCLLCPPLPLKGAMW